MIHLYQVYYSNYRGIASRGAGVNGRTDGRPDGRPEYMWPLADCCWRREHN